MRLSLISALLYAAMTLGANPVFADMTDAKTLQTILDLRQGDMRKLTVHNAPTEPVNLAFQDRDGNSVSFDDTAGTFRLVNFWATWCAPCREEMPALDRVNMDMGDSLTVLTIATGRNRLEGIDDFYAQTEIRSLPVLLDPRGELARSLGVVGLPVTLVLDPENREVARLIGGADWASEDAKAVLSAIIEAY